MSDLHLGKSGHFRKAGIGIPQDVLKTDLHVLLSQVQYFKPSLLLVVGDMFHSENNLEHELFLRWRKDIPQTKFALVAGNHDILDRTWYKKAGIDIYADSFSIKEFGFVHDISKPTGQNYDYHFSGHIHPGIRINGQGKQLVQLPCFYFGASHAVLPAFGKFTGTHAIKPEPGDTIFAIAGNKVIRVK